jgi:hypothetical protein
MLTACCVHREGMKPVYTDKWAGNRLSNWTWDGWSNTRLKQRLDIDVFETVTLETDPLRVSFVACVTRVLGRSARVRAYVQCQCATIRERLVTVSTFETFHCRPHRKLDIGVCVRRRRG